MAQNLVEQIFGLARSILTGAPTQSPSTGATHPSHQASVSQGHAQVAVAASSAADASAAGKTGVERYLERLGLVAVEAEGAPTDTGLTSVERYLRLHGLTAQDTSAVPGAADASTGLTGVERYLAMQAEATKPPEPAKAKAPTAVQEAAAEKSVKPGAAPKAAATPVPEPAAAAAKEPDAMPKRSPAPRNRKAADAPSPDPEITGQCQAATVKGTQCRHTTGLTHIERTIDHKKTRFIVCMQHADDSFKLFKGSV